MVRASRSGWEFEVMVNPLMGSFPLVMQKAAVSVVYREMSSAAGRGSLKENLQATAMAGE